MGNSQILMTETTGKDISTVRSYSGVNISNLVVNIGKRMLGSCMRRARDSNPRSTVRRTTDFESAPFDHSGSSPKRLQN
jgi:hypothetical protein